MDNTTAAPFDVLAKQLSPEASLEVAAGIPDEYLRDATEERGEPSALVMAATEADVRAAVRFAGEHNLTIVPRGAGTGLSGGCVPTPGCLLLSTERIDNIDIDTNSRTAVCGPGASTNDLLTIAGQLGLTYPPDPASYEESTLGGNVAENAGGLRCKRFGVTRDYVVGLRAVTIDNQIINTGMLAESDIGFNLADLLIGSEGTLAVITEIALRLTPQITRGTTMLVTFDKPKDAASAVTALNTSGITLTVMEFLDGDAAACSNEYEKTEGLDKAAAMLLLETVAETAERDVERIREICKANHCSYLRVAEDEAEVDSLWRVRRNLSKACKALSKVRISEDVAVPNSRFPELVSFVAELNGASPLRINSYGHAGDGNLHVNFMSHTGSDDDHERMEREIETVLKKAIELGGTLSGEHGIGTAKRRFLHLEFDPSTLAAMKAVKEVFDPSGQLNPDKIFT